MLDALDELIEKTFGNLMSAQNIFEMLLVIITISVVPAFCEEFMFRGYIQGSFAFKIKPYFAALITAIFFALYHLNPYGLIPLAVLGFYFGFAAYKSQSLVIPITLHFLNNFSAIMLYYTIGDDELITGKVSESSALNMNIEFFFLMMALFVALMIFIKQYYSKNKKLVGE
jgi:membrane protease YdiL (CAAX protease family)